MGNPLKFKQCKILKIIYIINQYDALNKIKGDYMSELSRRFSEDFLNNVSSAVNISEFMSTEYGTQFKKAGKNLIAKCPFPDHDDKSPSFSVSDQKQVCNCFGCGGGGGVFDIVMAMDNVNFPDAVKKVAAFAGIEVPTQSAPKNERTSALRAMLSQASAIFQKNHTQRINSVASDALNLRGVTADTVQRFALGTASNGWSQVCDTFENYKRANLLADSGLAVYSPKTDTDKAKLYDRFRDGIIFPIRETNGQVVSFAQRLPEGRKPKYINGAETAVFKKNKTLYGLYESLQSNRMPDRLVVVEGYFDVITSHQNGINNTVSPMGTALTPEQIERLLRHTSAVVFCFDGDTAGIKAAKRSLINALPYVSDTVKFSFCFLPDGQDPDDFVKKNGGSAFNKIIDEAQPLSRYIFSMLMDGRNISSREALANASVEFTDLLNLMPSSLLKQDIKKIFTDLTGFEINDQIDLEVSVRNMSPQKLTELSQEVKSFFVQQSGVTEADVSVNIKGATSSLATPGRFVNTHSPLKQAIPYDATAQTKVGLLNQSMEHVLINTGLSFSADLSDIPVIQLLSDANATGNSPAEKRLSQLSGSLLRNLHKNNDFAVIIKDLAFEVSRISKVSTDLKNATPAVNEKTERALTQFQTQMTRNVQLLQSFSRYATSETAYIRQISALDQLKGELKALPLTTDSIAKPIATTVMNR